MLRTAFKGKLRLEFSDYRAEVRDQFDDDWAKQYRLIDEASTDEAFAHYGDRLAQITASFDAPIDVLDIGCGTGRYFHRLQNVRCLVGLDLSQPMLDQARAPLHADRVRAQSIDLICGEIHDAHLPQHAFDFIYSIGVFGEYSPLDLVLLRRCEQLLRPSGTVFVTAVDSASRLSEPEAAAMSLPRRILRKFWPILPKSARIGFNRRLSPHYVSRRELEQLWNGAGRWHCRIDTFDHIHGWAGRHFDCLARIASDAA